MIGARQTRSMDTLTRTKARKSGISPQLPTAEPVAKKKRINPSDSVGDNGAKGQSKQPYVL